MDPSTGGRGFGRGREDLAYASQSCFQERQPHYRAAHFLYLAAITVGSPNRNITNRWTRAAVPPFSTCLLRATGLLSAPPPPPYPSFRLSRYPIPNLPLLP